MAMETEIKLSLPASAARRAACTPALLANSQPIRQKLVNTYYDTPTGACSQTSRRALPPQRLDMAADRQE
jgi:inorganic triphosphatase YgiF